MLGGTAIGATLGEARDAMVITPQEEDDVDRQMKISNHSCDDSCVCDVRWVDTVLEDAGRKQKLIEQVGSPYLLDTEQIRRLHNLLSRNHRAFALEPGERGETDMVSMEIDTGDTPPRRQPPRRMPFSVRQEVCKQLEEMQKNGVIQPSNSPWVSPVVLIRKKDGSHRFCVDYRGLNTVTKADTFPLPRIEDLLDQLGKSSH